MRPLPFVLALLFLISDCSSQSRYSSLTPTRELPRTLRPVDVPERFHGAVAGGHRLQVPEGYTVKVFYAGRLNKPRFFAWGPDSVLYVANKNSGEIIALPDRDHDGEADTAIVAVAGLYKSHDLKFYHGAMYVAEEQRIIRCTDNDGDGVYESRSVFIDNIMKGGHQGGGGHDTRTIVFDPVRKKMFLSIGSLCNACREEERAIIEEWNDDGTGRRTFATGCRNAIGMTMYGGRLWATNNGMDWQGDDIPPEWIDIVRDGGFYGYPYAYGDGEWVDFSAHREYRDLLPLTANDSAKVRSMVRPAALVQAHTAPMAIEFSNPSFPPPYRYGAFVALRGSWNRSVPAGYKVVFLHLAHPSDTAFTAVSDVVTGFHDAAERGSVWGRPVGLETDARGNLYFGSDDRTQAIFILQPGR